MWFVVKGVLQWYVLCSVLTRNLKRIWLCGLPCSYSASHVDVTIVSHVILQLHRSLCYSYIVSLGLHHTYIAFNSDVTSDMNVALHVYVTVAQFVCR